MKLAHSGNSKKVVGTFAVLVVLGMGLAATASAAEITLQTKTLADLFLTATATPVSNSGSILITTVSAPDVNPVLSADVYSACYKTLDGQGNDIYVYLYQIENNGTTGYHPVEQFTIWPFIEPAVAAGYITGTVMNGFIGAGTAITPEPTGFFENELLSFYFGRRYQHQIPVGDHSSLMFVTSPWGPKIVTGNIIDGAVATGDVIGPRGPVPEPATMAILAIGGGLMLVRNRRRK